MEGPVRHAQGPLRGRSRGVPRGRPGVRQARGHAEPAALGAGTQRRPAGLARRGQAVHHRAGHTGTVRRRGDRGLPLPLRGDGRTCRGVRGVAQLRFRPAGRHRRPLPRRPGHRGAAGALAAADGGRRVHRRDRHDRTRRGQRPAGHPHHRGQGRRRLGAQRRQDIHYQRDQLRPGDRGGAHRPRRGRARNQPARGGARHARLHPRPQAGQDRPACAGHRRAVLRRRSGCPRPTCSAARAAASCT